MRVVIFFLQLTRPEFKLMLSNPGNDDAMASAQKKTPSATLGSRGA
jgi:hypothetical protein